MKVYNRTKGSLPLPTAKGSVLVAPRTVYELQPEDPYTAELVSYLQKGMMVKMPEAEADKVDKVVDAPIMEASIASPSTVVEPLEEKAYIEPEVSGDEAKDSTLVLQSESTHDIDNGQRSKKRRG